MRVLKPIVVENYLEHQLYYITQNVPFSHFFHFIFMPVQVVAALPLPRPCFFRRCCALYLLYSSTYLTSYVLYICRSPLLGVKR